MSIVARRVEPTAGRQRGEQAGEQRVVVGDPVEDGVGEDGVDARVELERCEVRGEHRRAITQQLAGRNDHRGRAVHGDDMTARQAVEQLDRHPARPTAGVEHRLVAA
jgi:hypothetical protein